MVRTVISIDEDDKAWLDRTAKAEGVPITELIRRAVRLLRSQAPVEPATIDERLAVTRGLWRHGDGLAYQDRVRREW